MSDMEGLALGLAHRTKGLKNSNARLKRRYRDAEERAEQLELELKVEICSHAGTVAQNKALKGVLDGKWTRDYLNEVVGTLRNGGPLYRFGRIFNEAFIAKAKEVDLEKPELHLP